MVHPLLWKILDPPLTDMEEILLSLFYVGQLKYGKKKEKGLNSEFPENVLFKFAFC